MIEVRNDWEIAEIKALFELPFNDLLYKAHSIHRETFDPNKVQVSSLLNIKTGACPEDCSYCSQSSKYDTGLEREKLMEIDEVLKQAQNAKNKGATRFCMGAAWRNPTDKSLDKVIPMIQGVKAMGMETCVTLGMLSPKQDMTKPIGEWNSYLITIDHKINFGSVVFNGIEVVKFPLSGEEWDSMVAGTKFANCDDKPWDNCEFGKFKTGKICFQDHGAKVYFKNIKIKELEL